MIEKARERRVFLQIEGNQITPADLADSSLIAVLHCTIQRRDKKVKEKEKLKKSASCKLLDMLCGACSAPTRSSSQNDL